jgi:hypothetical protein
VTPGALIDPSGVFMVADIIEANNAAIDGG